MATETVPDKTLNTKHEPKGTNRMAGDVDKSDGGKAVNDALLIIGISWGILALLVLSLREYNVG